MYLPTAPILDQLNIPKIVEMKASSLELLGQFDRWRQMVELLVDQVVSMSLDLDPGPRLVKRAKKLFRDVKAWTKNQAADSDGKVNRFWIPVALKSDPEKFSNVVCIQYLTNELGTFDDDVSLEYVAFRLAAEHYVFTLTEPAISIFVRLWPLRLDTIRDWMNWGANPKDLPVIKELNEELKKMESRTSARIRSRALFPAIDQHTTRDKYDLSAKVPIIPACAYLTVLRTLKLRYNWVSGGF